MVTYDYFKLLVTTDSEVADLFANSINLYTTPLVKPTAQSRRYRSAKQVYNLIKPEQKSSLLVDPYDQKSWSRAVHFEYSLGFGEGATENNFKFKLCLLDNFGDLELMFVDNLLDQQKFQSSLNDYIKRLNPNQLIELGNTRLAGQPNLNGLSLNKNLLTRTFYFIFINKEDTYLPPIASQYFKATVDQSSANYLGNRILNLEFITTGHPNVQSNLASITSQKSLYVAEDIFKEYKSLEYKIEINWNFNSFLSNPKILDIEIKKCLRNIFQNITGKEVILLLPDFGKLFETYKNSLGSSLIKTASEAVAQSPGFTIAQQNANNFQELKSFLNELGFKFVDKFTNSLYSENKRLSSEDINSLVNLRDKLYRIIENIEKSSNIADFTKIIKSLLDLNYLETKGSIFRDDYFDSKFTLEDSKYLMENSFTNELESSFSRTNYGNHASRLETVARYTGQGNNVIDQLGNLIKNKPIYNNQLGRNISFDERKKLLISLLKEIFIVKYEKALKAVNSKADIFESVKSANKTTSSKEVDFEVDVFSVSGTLIFTIDSKEVNKSGNIKRLNVIDFNEFLNNFSIKLSSLGNNNFILKFSEENDLSRLKVLKQNCFYETYNTGVATAVAAAAGATTGGAAGVAAAIAARAAGPIIKTPLIFDDKSPAILIYDEWMMNNLYAPIDGFVDDSKLSFYPISEIDLSNYKSDSFYQKFLRADRVVHGFDYSGILLPFDRINNDWSPVNSNIFDETLGKALYLTAGNLKAEPPEEINKSSRSLPVFVFKPNDPNTNNIINYNLVADTTNLFVGFNSYVKEAADLIIDDSLQSATINAMIGALGSSQALEEAKKDLARYIKTNNQSILNGLKDYLRKKVSDNLKTNFNTPNTLTIDALTVIGTNDQKNSLNRRKDLLALGTSATSQEQQELSDLNDTLNNSLLSQLDLFVSNIIDNLYQNYILYPDDKGVFSIVQSYLTKSSDPIGAGIRRFNLTNHLYNKIYTLNIKTYAYFQINNLFMLNSPAYVLIFKDFVTSFNDFGVVYQNNQIPESVKAPSVISGFYQIIGFKHVMQFKSSGNPPSWSEFTLRKNINFGSSR